MFRIHPNTSLEFLRITGYDINVFLTAFSTFQKQFYPMIVAFYGGQITEANRSAFQVLKNLEEESNVINNLIYQFKASFTTINDWFLIDTIEDIRTRIWSINKLGKYSRSAVTDSNYNSTPEFIHVLSDGETLEDVNDNIIQSQNSNDWTKIAVRNDLSEVDYESEQGGNQLFISKTTKTSNFYLKGVVDNLFGERLYGLDLNKQLTFVLQEDGSYDLDVLGYRDTFKQSVEILAGLTKGDVPEFLNMGVEGGMGNSIIAFLYKSVVRQLEETFRTDDTIVNFAVKKFSYNNGNVFVEYEVNSFYNLVQKDKIQL